MNRYRLVTRTTITAGGKTRSEEHVSSVIQTEDEARTDIDVEESLARAAGWSTVRLHPLECDLDDDCSCLPELVCNRGRLVRSISVRESSWDTDIIT